MALSGTTTIGMAALLGEQEAATTAAQAEAERLQTLQTSYENNWRDAIGMHVARFVRDWPGGMRQVHAQARDELETIKHIASGDDLPACPWTTCGRGEVMKRTASLLEAADLWWASVPEANCAHEAMDRYLDLQELALIMETPGHDWPTRSETLARADAYFSADHPEACGKT